jgi:hypothetical protein
MSILPDSEVLRGSTAARDCAPVLLDVLGDAERAWLERLVPAHEDVMPVLRARQQMSGPADVWTYPSGVSASFRVVRIGRTTFDVEGVLTDDAGRAVARSTSVLALVSTPSHEATPIPGWLDNMLQGEMR